MSQLDLNFTGKESEHELFRDLAPHIVENFFIFHAQNPQVYESFKKYARQLQRTGREHHSSQAIIERIRWDTMVESKNDDFKINNNWPSCYSRLLMIHDRSFFGFFRTRRTPGTVNPFEGWNPPD